MHHQDTHDTFRHLSQLPQARFAVRVGALQQRFLRRRFVRRVAAPRRQHRSLQRAPVRKRERPRVWVLFFRKDVHFVEVLRGLHLGLPAGEEQNTRHRGGHDAAEALHGFSGDDVGTRFDFRADPARDHVGFQDHALHHHAVRVELGEHGLQDAFRHLLAHLDVVVAVRQDLRLDDGDEARLLADGGVSWKYPFEKYTLSCLDGSATSDFLLRTPIL